MASHKRCLMVSFVALMAWTQNTNGLSFPRHQSDPLLLTPYLDRNDIELARNLSVVNFNEQSLVPLSYSGYLTVDREFGNHFFFWHFPSTVNAEAPLMIWLNGGPAVSSMIGLFWEHGPLEADKDKFGDSYGIREHTWVGPYSVVYIDNPVGTGYSYSDSAARGNKLTQDGYTNDLYSFVLQFFKMFPEYAERGLYIGGQSYAGKYIPALAYRMFTRRHTETAHIKLQGILLGGPYFDPPTESVAFFDYLYAVGAISHYDMVRHKEKVRSMYQDFLDGKNKNATFSALFEDLVLLNELPLPSLDNYVSGQEADYSLVQTIMTSTEMRRAIHVGERQYSVSNNELSQAYGPDVMVSTKREMAVLMDNVKVLIYNGDYDVVVSSVMIEAALLTTEWSLQGEYNKTHRKFWKADSSLKSRLKGFYSKTGNFCRVVIHGAGHQTPHDMPDSTLEMVTDFLEHGCIHQEN
ncbi:unnamed protein product [Lymnaea stagnalis]|uniref:Serine carboxypeptidase n=1 Tax=Lymnaea stagnalis TaxID=6523 RepID=A0AAV2IP16_LYMST